MALPHPSNKIGVTCLQTSKQTEVGSTFTPNYDAGWESNKNTKGNNKDHNYATDGVDQGA